MGIQSRNNPNFKKFRTPNLGILKQNDIWVQAPWPNTNNIVKGKVVVMAYDTFGLGYFGISSVVKYHGLGYFGKCHGLGYLGYFGTSSVVKYHGLGYFWPRIFWD
jgi:hypothetical protein